MVEFDEPSPVKRNLLLTTALVAVSIVAGIAIIGDALPTSKANAAVTAQVPLPVVSAAVATDGAEQAAGAPDQVLERGPSANTLINATFAALPDENALASRAADIAADAVPEPPKDVAELAPPVEGGQPDEMTSVRKVRTTPIRLVSGANGMTAIPQPDEAKAPMSTPAPLTPPVVAATEAAEPEVEDEPVQVAALDVPVETPIVAPEPKMKPAAKPQAAAEEQAEPEKKAKSTGARVGRSAVNARSGPSKSAGKVFVVDAGERVTAKETYRGWVLLADAEGREGWVYSDFLTGVNVKSLPVADKPAKTAAAPKPKAEPAPKVAETKAAPRARTEEVKVEIADRSDEPETPDVKKADGAFTSTEHVNVRAEPSKDGGKLFVLSPGQQVTVKATSKGWSQIVTAEGKSGWVYANVK